jgi:hypothetical protein
MKEYQITVKGTKEGETRPYFTIEWMTERAQAETIGMELATLYGEETVLLTCRTTTRAGMTFCTVPVMKYAAEFLGG